MRFNSGSYASVSLGLYSLLTLILQENGGFVVVNALSADFCILSINIPNVGAIADELMSEGKLAVQDYWIRDSVDAASLLPWYTYQVTPSSFAPGDTSQDLGMMSAGDVEERDIHELVVTTARYGALISANELYRHLSRKVTNRQMAVQRIILTIYSVNSALIALQSHSSVYAKPIVSILNHASST